MDPGPDSPVSRVGRTFWTFWNYITETVSRLLRPEPPITEINDQNTTQEASVNNEHFDSGHTDYATTKEGEEQRHFAPASSLSSSRPVVFWDTGSELETENVDKTYKEGEGMREEEMDETGIDVANLPIADNATEDNQEECSNLKIDAEDVMVKTLEGANIWSLPDEALNVEIKEPKQNSCGVEEPDGTITLDKQQADQLNETDKQDFNELHSSLGSETEDITKLDTKTVQKEHSELQDEKKNLQSDDMTVIQSNQGLEGIPSLTFPETLPHVEFEMSDDNWSIVPECEPTVDKPEHTVADISDESANGKTENEEKENPGKEIDRQELDANVLDGEESEMAQRSEEDVITKNITCSTLAAAEDGDHDNATDSCLVTQKVDLDAEGIFDINDYNDDLTRLSTEKESGMEKLCLSSSDAVTHEGGFGQEETKAFKNIPPAKSEGQDSVSGELYSSYKESQEGVPEHNNEAESNRSTTQRFLEVGNCREVQTTLLQEEVESGEAKHLQNSNSEAEADSFEETELMETEPNKDRFEVDNVGTLTEKIIALSDNVMKTVVDDKDFEAYFASKDEVLENLKEETKEILVEFEMGESLCEVETAADGRKEIEMANVAGFTQDKFYETEFQKVNESVFLDQTTDENDICTTLAQRESQDESLVEMHYTGINLKDMEEDLCTLKEESTKEKTISESNSEKYEVQLGVTVEDDKTMSSEDKLLDVGDHEISARLLSAEESMTDVCQTYKLDQLMCSEVIEDEILDLWIQQMSMENTDVTKGDQGEEEKLSELPEEEQVESNPELSMECDASVSSSTAESGFFDQSLDIGGLHQCKKQEQESAKIEQVTNLSSTLSESEDTSEFSIIESELETPWKEDLLSKHVRSSLDASSENTDDEAQTLQNIEAEVSMSSPVMKAESKFADNEPLKRITLFEVEAMVKDQSDSSAETDNTVLMSDTPLEICQLTLQEKPKEEALSCFSTEEDKDIDEVAVSELDFTPQKSRIAVKNPLVRPPKDPRSLLHKPSLEPSPLKHEPSHVPASVPLRGLGIGVKLPGLGAGFPVLKKTKKTVAEETETTTKEMKPEENDDKLKQEDSQHKPKWLPKQHPGFGNPLMSELKSKLKKTAKE